MAAAHSRRHHPLRLWEKVPDCTLYPYKRESNSNFDLCRKTLDLQRFQIEHMFVVKVPTLVPLIWVWTLSPKSPRP